MLKANAYARVNQVMEYAGFRGCRHARIADYFGEQGVARTCMACDNCLDTNRAPYAAVDPVHVNAALACVARFDGHLGGVRIASILRGSTDAWTASRGWVTELPSFGALRGWELERIRELLERLVELGCLSRGHGEKPTLGITARGGAVLRGEETIDVDVRAPRAPRAGRQSQAVGRRHIGTRDVTRSRSAVRGVANVEARDRATHRGPAVRGLPRPHARGDRPSTASIERRACRHPGRRTREARALRRCCACCHPSDGIRSGGGDHDMPEPQDMAFASSPSLCCTWPSPSTEGQRRRSLALTVGGVFPRMSGAPSPCA